MFSKSNKTEYLNEFKQNLYTNLIFNTACNKLRNKNNKLNNLVPLKQVLSSSSSKPQPEEIKVQNSNKTTTTIQSRIDKTTISNSETRSHSVKTAHQSSKWELNSVESNDSAFYEPTETNNNYLKLNTKSYNLLLYNFGKKNNIFYDFIVLRDFKY